jgi:hypothetical protein
VLQPCNGYLPRRREPTVIWRIGRSGAESRLEGGGGKLAKPKIYKIKQALRSGVSVRIKFKSEREGKQIKVNEHGDLFYRGSVPKNLVLVEEFTKTGSISTVSLSQTVT